MRNPGVPDEVKVAIGAVEQAISMTEEQRTKEMALIWVFVGKVREMTNLCYIIELNTQ